jgi:hypothetical protein
MYYSGATKAVAGGGMIISRGRKQVGWEHLCTRNVPHYLAMTSLTQFAEVLHFIQKSLARALML